MKAVDDATRIHRLRRRRHAHKRYHLLLPVIQEQTTFERILTFQTDGHVSVTHGLELGSDVHVGYTQAPTGRMTAQVVS